jgi:hypothetical protein
VEAQLRHADHRIEMAKLVSNLHIQALNEDRAESKEEIQAYRAALREYQEIFAVQYLLSLLDYFPQITDEERILNERLLEASRIVVDKDDE